MVDASTKTNALVRNEVRVHRCMRNHRQLCDSCRKLIRNDVIGRLGRVRREISTSNKSESSANNSSNGFETESDLLFNGGSESGENLVNDRDAKDQRSYLEDRFSFRTL
ncbi:hypothetical protein KIN20_035933 [Parelaphostrongylus tenuis]|uniref:Uncharacterized protein n=1 Tax=Parelaphostrongylus tenuis TaxID=148309 RepID=A0AAD5RBX6_PARTN|nr:hypothetical protein KIN20_035933 [Parelaphostrongylus tenuis]